VTGPAPEGPTRGGSQNIPRPAGARAGGGAPWAGLPAAERVVTLDAIRAAFTGRLGARSAIEDRSGVRPSAVLAPLYEQDGEVFVVLTRRGRAMRSHRGEVSFPGGLSEPGEDVQAAALRETFEEIGLAPDRVEIVGELDHLTTVSSRSYIVPHVGVLPGERPALTPNPAEVDLVLHVPLAELLLDEVYREERWMWAGVERPIFFFELVGDTVWGATAAMLRQLLALTLGFDAPLGHP
jgi:8-oxo-dGTP pyrophosphatase MutT (NUDIX family)